MTREEVKKELEDGNTVCYKDICNIVGYDENKLVFINLKTSNVDKLKSTKDCFVLNKG